MLVNLVLTALQYPFWLHQGILVCVKFYLLRKGSNTQEYGLFGVKWKPASYHSAGRPNGLATDCIYLHMCITHHDAVNQPPPTPAICSSNQEFLTQLKASSHVASQADDAAVSEPISCSNVSGATPDAVTNPNTTIAAAAAAEHS